jgi:ankyrin repeat protein
MGSSVAQSLSSCARLAIVGGLTLAFSCLLATVALAELAQTNAEPVTLNGEGVLTKGSVAIPDAGLLALFQKSFEPLPPGLRTNLSLKISAGANLEEKDTDRRTALTLAVMRGDFETVKLLVQAGANVKARDRFHKTPLFYATDAGRRDIVDYLASNGDLQSPTPQERKERNRR